MSKSLEKYIDGKDVKLSELDFPLFIYVIKERWIMVIFCTLVLLLIFLIGYYIGFGHGIDQVNALIEEASKGAVQWII